MTKQISISSFYAIFIILICHHFYPGFFHVDDVNNEMLGFYHQYGKIWSEGHIPLIVDTLWNGGNAVIDLGKGVFSPQAIIGSLLSHQLDNSISVVPIILAFINLFILCFSCISLGQTVGLNQKYCYVFAAFTAIQPLYLFWYQAGWWNAANGQVWATAAIAALFYWRKNFTIHAALLQFLTVLFLLLSGWPHGTLSYMMVFAVIVLFDQYHQFDLRRLILLGFPAGCAFLCAVPIYSEYIALHELFSRPDGINNIDNFLSPPISSILFSFFPSRYDFMSFFGGYRLIILPFAFSIIFLPAALLLRSFQALWQNKNVKIISFLIFLFFILSQVPSQTFSMRYPFRFLPFLSLFIAL